MVEYCFPVAPKPNQVSCLERHQWRDIDHIVPLKWAHGHGGDRWTLNQKREFANDPENLLATQSSVNRRKGAKGPDQWLPAINPCEYATRWKLILEKYGLNVLSVERDSLDQACF